MHIANCAIHFVIDNDVPSYVNVVAYNKNIKMLMGRQFFYGFNTEIALKTEILW